MTDSGLASVVTSASAARPNSSSISVSSAARWPAGSSVGVPPPKNTVSACGTRSPSTCRANRSSAIAASGYDVRVTASGPLPNSCAV